MNRLSLKKGDYVIDLHSDSYGEIGIILDVGVLISVKWIQFAESKKISALNENGEYITTTLTPRQFTKGSFSYRFKVISQDEAMVEML